MSLHRNQVIKLLQLAGSYDSRNPAQSMILAWEESATRGRWTFDEASEAIKNHYSNSTDFIMPGHITQLVRAARQAAAMREPLPAPSRPIPIDSSGWPVGDDPDFGARNSPELEKIHTAANEKPCAFCGAEPGQRCTNKKTGNATKIPHPRRLVAAGINRNYP